MSGVAQIVISLATRAIDAPFAYVVPNDMQVEIGDAVIVELGAQTVLGFVVGWEKEGAYVDAKSGKVIDLKPILAHIPGPFFTSYSYELAVWIARYYADPLTESLKLFLPMGLAVRLKKALSNYSATGEVKMPVRRPRKTHDATDNTQLNDLHHKPEKLTEGQREALTAVIQDSAPRNTSSKPIVLEGVTGSGKTEVYLQAIEAVRQIGKTAIMLVPEISLTPQTVGRIRSRFGDDVAVLHSGLSDGERYTQWEKARTGDCGVVIGARSALF
ncbi:MAG: DEAD/DEAH box helicase family protein, partial [Coriobacteriia bacterium]|nr:DEAD/DEAH box helicase family protein [Coriobacteriia bacterium]